MSTLGALIVDAQLAERQPVTARLMRAMRGLHRALGSRLGFSPAASGSSVSGTTMTTSLSVPLYLPDCCVGTLGTRLVIYNFGTTLVPGGSPIHNQRSGRLLIGATTSATFVHVGTSTTYEPEIDVTFVPGASNTEITIEFQGTCQPINTMSCSWLGSWFLEQVNA